MMFLRKRSIKSMFDVSSNATLEEKAETLIASLASFLTLEEGATELLLLFFFPFVFIFLL